MLARNSSILEFTSAGGLLGRDFVFCLVCATSPGTKGCSSGACYALGWILGGYPFVFSTCYMTALS